MGYTQSPPLTNEEIESFLEEAKIARFCSLNEDGTIHATPVWFKYEAGQIIIATPIASRKAKNAKRNNNVTVLIDVEEIPTRGAIIYGKAELDNLTNYEEYMSMAVSLFKKYIQEDQAEKLAKGLFKISRWVKITVKPERIASFDYAKDEAFLTALEG